MSSEPAGPTSVLQAAGVVLHHAMGASPTLGPGRLVCIDGPAGAGKTTLADAVVAAARRRVASVGLVNLDDLYEGWAGLGAALGPRIAREVLHPLAAGEPGRYRRWDWYADAWAEEHVVDPVALLVLEGVGAAATAYDDLVTTRVWVDAPRELRRRRGLERGGEGLAEHWDRWLDTEQALLAAEGTLGRADVVVDGTGAARPTVTGVSNPPR